MKYCYKQMNILHTPILLDKIHPYSINLKIAQNKYYLSTRDAHFWKLDFTSSTTWIEYPRYIATWINNAYE